MTENNLWQQERIRTVRRVRVRTHYPRVIGRNARLGSHGSGPTSSLAVVETESGAVGQGVVEPGGKTLPELSGKSLGELFDPDTGVSDPMAGALDLALHDLVARLLDVPVHRMLGGHGAPTVRCYSGAIYLDDLDPTDAPRGIEAVLQNCAADHAAGFRDFKLKIGRGARWMDAESGLRRDIEVTRAVRETYPEARLLVDANNGYTVEQFLAYLHEVDDCALFWVEEPFAESEHDLRRLRAYLREHAPEVRIADGEFDPDESQLVYLAEQGLLDVLLMDICTYGITAWRRLVPTLRELGVEASPHAWGLPLKTLYAAQLASGIGNVVTVEGVPGETEGVGTATYGLCAGMLRVPERAGFGVTVRET